MSVLLRKQYSSIKKEKLSEQAKSVLKSMYETTNGFKDAKATRKIKPKFEAFYNKLKESKPEAIVGAKVKSKAAPKKSADEFKAARERRKPQTGVPKDKKAVDKDASRPAISKRGKRTSKAGNTYYEYRDNRLDKNPSKYPMLEKGGYMAKGGEVKIGQRYILDSSKELSGGEFLPANFEKYKQVFVDEIINNEYVRVSGFIGEKGKEKYFKIVVKKSSLLPLNKIEKGGYMAKGGELEVGDKVKAKYAKYHATVTEIVDDVEVPYAKITYSDGTVKKADLKNLQKVELRVAEEYVNPIYMAKGGFVSKGELVWRKLSDSKKMEFLYKNFTPQITPRSQEILVGKDFQFLPKDVKIKLEAEYANAEEYSKGGEISVYNLRKGDKVKTRKGDIETIIRKTGSGSYETIENNYSHSPESLEFVSRPSRKMENGGELSNGFSIDEMKEYLNDKFPYSFGFKLYPIKEGTTFTPDYDAEILKGRSLKGLSSSDLDYKKLMFPKYKKSHEINYEVTQGGENTYFEFLLSDVDGNKYYSGTFGFKDQGDVDSEYVTRFIAFLMESYGLPFKVEHSVYAKGGGIYSSDSLYYLQVLKNGEEVGREKFRAKSLKEAHEIAEDDFEDMYESKFGEELSFIVSEAMEKGGETHRLDSIFEDGGEIAEGNLEMAMSNVKAIEHHAMELKSLLDENTSIEAWVVAKLERAETDLSDVTHYIDGLQSNMDTLIIVEQEFARGGYMENGGETMKEAYVQQVVEIATKANQSGIKASDLTYEEFSNKVFEATNTSYGKDYLRGAYEVMKNKGYARGGEITPYIIWVSKDGEKREMFGEYKSKRAADMKMNKLWESGEYKSMGNKPKSMYEKEGFYAEGGHMQGYDDREDERLSMEYGKMSSKDLDSTHARRDDARFEEKMAKGGETNYLKKWRVKGINMQGRVFKKEITLGRMSDKNDVMYALKRMPDNNISEVTLIEEIKEDGGMMAKGGRLSRKQKQLDLNKNGKLDSQDFKMLRAGRKNARKK